MVPDPAPSIDHAGLGSTPPDVLQALLGSLADAIYLVDHDGRVRFANHAALAILGYPEDELLGRPSHATIHFRRPDGRPCPEAECPLLRPRVTGETVRVEDDWFVRRDGTMVPVSYSSAPVATPGGRGAVVVFRDTTERRAWERAERREAAERARAEELQASRARILAATDAERRRLGRDIHDGAQQRLMNVAIGIQQGIAHLDDGPRATGLLTDALAEARTAIAELRELAAGIHPAILTHRGLHAAVASLTARSPLPTRFTVPDRRYPAETEAAAYFTIAEALANVAKHAGASRVDIDVREEDGPEPRLTIGVRDDGRGGADVAAGTGLQGLLDRVGAAGGTLAVTSPAGAGTTLTAELPLPA
jgi:PAS domain S-box-containing protein